MALIEANSKTGTAAELLFRARGLRAKENSSSQLFERALQNALDIYWVSDDAFTSDPRRVLRWATTLLSTTPDADPGLIDSPERALLTLAVANEWLHPDTLDGDKKGLYTMFKLLAVRPIISTRAVSRDLMSYSTYEYKNRFKHEPLTKTVSEEADSWGSGTPLHNVRTTLGITPETEKPYEIVVVDKSGRDIDREMIGWAFCDRSGVGSTIFLPRRWDEIPSGLQHEYAHSQSPGMYVGLGALLFRGIDEAITEDLTDDPSSYNEQRWILNRLTANIPQFWPFLINAYLDHGIARRPMITRLVAHYGLDGLLAVARLNAIANPEKVTELERKVYLPAAEVDQILSEIDQYFYAS